MTRFLEFRLERAFHKNRIKIGQAWEFMSESNFKISVYKKAYSKEEDESIRSRFNSEKEISEYVLAKLEETIAMLEKELINSKGNLRDIWTIRFYLLMNRRTEKSIRRSISRMA